MLQSLIGAEAAKVFSEHFAAIMQVFVAHVCAIALTFTSLNDFLKSAGLAVALGFGIWKWLVELRREQRLRIKEEQEEIKSVKP